MKGICIVLCAALLSGALAQAPAAPFFERPTELRHAYALDLIGLYLDVLELGSATAGAQADDEAGLLDTALPLLAGSLARADEGLLRRLEDALAATAGGRSRTIPEARDLLSEAESVLIPKALAADPAFRAARLAFLVSLEPGVGEGYDASANGEDAAYYVGYTGLQRAQTIWAQLEPDLNGDASDVNRAFGVLDTLFASPELPETFVDPEDAETAVSDIVFGLESLSGTTLIPRDFAALLDLLGADVSKACAAASAGNARLALEWATAAGFFYDAYLGDTLGMMAAEADARIDQGLGGFVEDPASEQLPGRCRNLSAAFDEASSVFGG